jgi:creatinine amidohydrolase
MRAMPMLRTFFVAALLLAIALPHQAGAQPGKTVFLEELTWTELASEVRGGRTTVIVPVGGTEQSGPQIVLGKHNVRAKVLAGRIATELGDALVAPVIAYVPEGSIEPPAAHMRFAGTISVPDAVFEGTLEAAARSFRRHGFRDIVLIGDHGGYQKSLATVAAKLNREWAAGPVRVHAVEAYYRASDAGFAALLKQKGYAEAEIGSHAGLADTALSLAVDPRLVRTDRLQVDAAHAVAEGVHGDPRRATAELGQAGVELIVARTVEAIRKEMARR